MRLFPVAIATIAGLLFFGCEHDLSKIPPAGDIDGSVAGNSGNGGGGGTSGSAGKAGSSGHGGQSGTSGTGEGGSGDTGGEGGTGTGTGTAGRAGVGGVSVSGTGGVGGTVSVSGTGGDSGTGGIIGQLVCGPDCSGDNLVDVCMKYCHAFCDNQERFCDFSRCPPRAFFCSPEGEGTVACLDSCDDMQCATTICQGERNRSCQDFADFCLGVGPTCDYGFSGTCRDTCFSWGDGECDDGAGPADLIQYCPWGTDCNDCGARFGDPPACSSVGCICEINSDCCGFYAGNSFCVGMDDGTAKCVAACSGPDTGFAECEPGFVCTELADGFGYACAPAG